MNLLEKKIIEKIKPRLEFKSRIKHVLFTSKRNYNFMPGCNFSMGARILCPNVDNLIS